jgi:glutamate-1-semialdehyde 2,1-aminomutase
MTTQANGEVAGRAEELYLRARKVMPGGNSRATISTKPYPPYARSGSGFQVTDEDGVTRLDFVNNMTALIHGNAHPAIVAAVSRRVAEGTGFALPTLVEIELAELLCSRVPSFEGIRFLNSGTEALMVAIKAARAYTGRRKIAKCEGAYHGGYDYAEISDFPEPATWGQDAPAPVAPGKGSSPAILPEVVVIPFNDTERALEILAPHADELAAVIVDPMPQRVGLVPARPDFVAGLRKFTRDHGSLLIFDEVIAFRLGYRGAQGVWGIDPDLTGVAKIIGGGFPIGAVAGRTAVMSVFDGSAGRPLVPQSGTFSANPVSMVAGRVAMELMTEAAFDRLNALGDYGRDRLVEAFRAAGVPGQVTGMGSLLRVHFSDEPLTDFRSVHRASVGSPLSQVYRYLLDHGIMITTGGLISLSTPMDRAQLDQLAETFLAALRSLASTGRPRAGQEAARPSSR